jgi:cobalt/nickel transport system ATP-binding protein
MKKVIELSGVFYNYPNGYKAIQDASFEVFEGDRIAILGSNGAGKSTLLMLLAGLVKPNKGIVKVFGFDTKSKEFENIRMKIGVVFQNPDEQLFCPTIWEDITFGLENLGLKEEEIKLRANEALEFVGLLDYKQRAPHRLSVGEKKKASIATALALNPDILLLDEPTANLEPSLKRDFILLLNKLYKKKKMSIIIATHDVDLIPYIAKKVYLLERGKVIAKGEIKEILSNFGLLTRCKLEPPIVTKLFKTLNDIYKLRIKSLPLTIEEAINLMRRLDTKYRLLHPS